MSDREEMAQSPPTFEAMYRAHAAHVLAYCARRTSRDEARDAAAEVFVIALRRIDDVPVGDGALPWLYTVASNVLRNQSRSSRRRLRLVAKLSHSEPTVQGPEPLVVRSSEQRDLLAALARLSDKDQEVLRLVEWEGLSREQVAEMHDVSRAAIDQRISRSYKKLARILRGAHDVSQPAAVMPVEEGGEA